MNIRGLVNHRWQAWSLYGVGQGALCTGGARPGGVMTLCLHTAGGHGGGAVTEESCRRQQQSHNRNMPASSHWWPHCTITVLLSSASAVWPLTTQLINERNNLAECFIPTTISFLKLLKQLGIKRLYKTKHLWKANNNSKLRFLSVWSPKTQGTISQM